MEQDLFLDFLKSYKNNRKFYKTIKILSKSSEKDPRYVLDNNVRMLSCDKFSEIIHKQLLKDDSSHCQHSSVDALYYFFTPENELKLIFVEFKHISSEEKNKYEEKLDIFRNELKIKPLESLSCIFPHLIDKYCKENNLTIEENKLLKSFLFKCPKAYYCVIKDSAQTNDDHAHAILNQDLVDIKRLSKYPFNPVDLMTPKGFEEYIKFKFGF